MKRISFQHTAKAVLDAQKTQTRRQSDHLYKTCKQGDRLQVVDRMMGFKKGERQRVLGVIEITASPRREPLASITAGDVCQEGVAWARTPADFIREYCRRFGGGPEQLVTVLEFQIVEWSGAA